eukprot:jgi/Botrbrau1/12837/Bobra.0045s0006.1
MCLKSRQSSRTVAGEARTYDLSACLQDTPLPITFNRLWAHALPAEPRADRSAWHHRMHLYWVFHGLA